MIRYNDFLQNTVRHPGENRGPEASEFIRYRLSTVRREGQFEGVLQEAHSRIGYIFHRFMIVYKTWEHCDVPMFFLWLNDLFSPHCPRRGLLLLTTSQGSAIGKAKKSNAYSFW